MIESTGKLQKMHVTYADPVQYRLLLDHQEISLHDYIGHEMTIAFSGEIRCILCDRHTAKSYGQGFCYPCFRDAPENAECIIRPELCRAHYGEGRDPQWEEEHHNQPHAVYLALTSAVKVGVTRWNDVPTRWIDQGAYQAVVVAKTPYRQLAGAIEVASKPFYTDRTNWQRMLKDERLEGTDLIEERERLLKAIPEGFRRYGWREKSVTTITYPLETPPRVVKSLNLDKKPVYNGVLAGIRGQYLIFRDNTVFNVRRHSGYVITIKLM